MLVRSRCIWFLSLALACSHSLKVGTKDAAVDSAEGGGSGGDGGAPVGGWGGDGGLQGGSGGGGAGGIALVGTGGCWWKKSPGAGGMQPGEHDGWPDSPTRTPGAATVRARIDGWTAISPTNAPSGPRQEATAIWSGKEMIVWGGYDGRPEATGGRYDPATDSWKPVSTSVAPRARRGHVAVWTGSEMLVWGGYDGSNYLSSGGRYDPVANTWTAMDSTKAPTGTTGPYAVWTGTEMIVWGGQNAVTSGRYSPATNTWRFLATVGAPLAQVGSSAVWTGSEMIVWGGYATDACASALGAIYNPATDSWRAMTNIGAPHPRVSHTAVWTGTQMIVWGGDNLSVNAGSYDLASDTWNAVSEVEGPLPRINPAGFFVPDLDTPGSGRMIVWGGGYGNDAVTGGIYDFVPDRWQVVAPFPSIDAMPNGFASRTTVWTGSEFLVWDVAFGVGGRYRP
jgi:hypothetical protein